MSCFVTNTDNQFNSGLPPGSVICDEITAGNSKDVWQQTPDQGNDNGFVNEMGGASFTSAAEAGQEAAENRAELDRLLQQSDNGFSRTGLGLLGMFYGSVTGFAESSIEIVGGIPQFAGGVLSGDIGLRDMTEGLWDMAVDGKNKLTDGSRAGS